MTTYTALLPVAIEAMELARTLIEGQAPGTITSKGDRDMASQLDYHLESTVRAYLRDTTPEIGFTGEEGGSSGPDSDLRWVLDPIDGTANLIHGLPLWAVSLALVARERPLLGVIDVPLLDSRYTAVEGHGATVNGEPINVSKTTHMIDAVVSIGDYAVGPDAEQKNQRRLAVTALLAGHVQRVRMFGSAAIDLVWLAHGRTDATIILSNNAWDMAAGVVIAREAGATVVDHTGAPHTFASRTTIAAAPGVSGQILHLVQRVA